MRNQKYEEEEKIQTEKRRKHQKSFHSFRDQLLLCDIWIDMNINGVLLVLSLPPSPHKDIEEDIFSEVPSILTSFGFGSSFPSLSWR